jgi:hypothetical protein
MKLKKCKVGMKVAFNQWGSYVITRVNKRSVDLQRGYVCYTFVEPKQLKRIKD